MPLSETGSAGVVRRRDRVNDKELNNYGEYITSKAFP